MRPLTTIDRNLLAAGLSTAGYGSKSQARAIIDAVIDDLSTALRAGHTIHIKGLGRFEAHTAPAKPGRNFKTGEPVTVHARRTLKFKASKSLLAEMNP